MSRCPHRPLTTANSATTSPRTPIDDVSFDGVMCALMLHHIADRPRLLGDLRRVLRPGGWLLVSTTHPTADWLKFGGSYYAEDWVDRPVAGGPLAVHYQRMPLETLATPPGGRTPRRPRPPRARDRPAAGTGTPPPPRSPSKPRAPPSPAAPRPTPLPGAPRTADDPAVAGGPAPRPSFRACAEPG
ncbi:class I SAM-dependent methyltransferase [Streptomyces sparsogenes]|uniref:class I SAM-dependent methyltransferase n=1 Tax=Streptomyces sparsogenes TaxID=67365 RepID=UPI0033E0DF73